MKVTSALSRVITATEKATQHALTLHKGSPEEWDGKPVSTFPGRKIKPVEGQLAIEDPR